MSRTFRFAGALVSALTLCASSGQLCATVFDAGSLGSVSGNTYVGDGFKIVGSADLKLKTVAGIQALGVGGGHVGGEIDTKGLTTEYLLIELCKPAKICDLTLSFLYPRGEFGDQVNETAKIYVNSLLGNPYELTATGAWSYNWNGLGTVNVLSPAQDGNPGPAGAGTFQVTNPFGDELVKFLFLKPDDSWCVSGGADSDFSLRGFSSCSVPDGGGTLLLLGAGLLGLVGLRRRID